MGIRIGTAGVFVLLSLSTLAQNAAAQGQNDFDKQWRQRTTEFINKIEDEKVLGRALYEFNPVRLRIGDVDGASADVARIANPQLQGYARYQVARFRKGNGDFEGAVAEVAAARTCALEQGYAYPHVDACLDIAESLEMAKEYVDSVEYRSSVYAQSSFAGALARRGFLQDALKVADRQADKYRPYTLRTIAAERAKRADILNTEQLLQRITEDKSKDGVYVDLIRALSQRGRPEDAKRFVDQIKDPAVRHNAERMTGTIGGHPANEISIGELRNQIAAAESPNVQQSLYLQLLNQQLKKKDVPGAEATINAIVQLIQTADLEEIQSKFGNTTNASRIAFVEAKYLEIAGIHASRGDMDKGRAALQKAKKAMADMPDSSGMSKMFVVPGVLMSQIQFGEIDSVRKSIRSLMPVFWQQHAPLLIESFLDVDDLETATFIAETLLNGTGAGGAEILSTFIRAGHVATARELLEKVKIDSHIGHDVCRNVGSTMFQLDKTELLKEWVSELPAAVSAHLCIGVLRTSSSYLLEPTTDEERTLVSFLTVKMDLPGGYALEDRPHPNPGVYRPTSLPELAQTLRQHRDGRSPRLFLAAKATYVSEGQQDISAFVYRLENEADAIQLVSEVYMERFANRYLQKGSYVIFLDGIHGTERIAATQAIQTQLEKRDLAVPK